MLFMAHATSYRFAMYRIYSDNPPPLWKAIFPQAAGMKNLKFGILTGPILSLGLS